MMRFEIRIGGVLGEEWAGWFAGRVLCREREGETLLTCTLDDQAALFHLLRKVRDLGLPLLSVSRLDDGPDGREEPS